MPCVKHDGKASKQAALCCLKSNENNQYVSNAEIIHYTFDEARRIRFFAFRVKKTDKPLESASAVIYAGTSKERKIDESLERKLRWDMCHYSTRASCVCV